jgi:hypothetical protein
LAEAKALAGNTKAETVLKQLMEREQQRRDARAIRYANQKMRTGSVTFVVAPNSQGEWVEGNDQASMEQALMEENHRRFNQAAGTPFTVPPLTDYIDALGRMNMPNRSWLVPLRFLRGPITMLLNSSLSFVVLLLSWMVRDLT